jgi:hypothetical protein
MGEKKVEPQKVAIWSKKHVWSKSGFTFTRCFCVSLRNLGEKKSRAPKSGHLVKKTRLVKIWLHFYQMLFSVAPAGQFLALVDLLGGDECFSG